MNTYAIFSNKISMIIGYSEIKYINRCFKYLMLNCSNNYIFTIYSKEDISRL